MKEEEKKELISEYHFNDIDDIFPSLYVRQMIFDQFKLLHPSAEFTYMIYIGVHLPVYTLKIKITVDGNSFE
jgi:hypothetical protein